MAEITEKVIKTIEGFINDIKEHIPVDKAILYGSYAKGNYNEYSDIDIAIFSQSFNGKSFVETTAFLFSIARKYKEFCIEPIGFNTSDLSEDNPFVNEILNTGRELPLH